MNSTLNVKQWAIATVAVFVVMSAIQYLIHGALLSDWYAEHSHYWRSPEDMMSRMHWMYVGYALFAGLFCYIFSLGYEGKPGIGEGFRYGALIGALIGFPKMFTDHAVFYYQGKVIVAWGVGMFVTCILLGILAGMIYKGGKQAAS